MTNRITSDGQRALLGECRRGFAAASRRCHVNVGTLRRHAYGERVPDDASRAAYLAAFAIPLESWPPGRSPSARLTSFLTELDERAPA